METLADLAVLPLTTAITLEGVRETSPEPDQDCKAGHSNEEGTKDGGASIPSRQGMSIEQQQS
jgi:hypothetical protein